ncbi:hypothetical protein IC229_26030 [Spirosoma sp. BT702]|uniref:Fibronectin type-III domain-containing protein n=1 Tax=Spirosoma profusum TaxID=2771354 RepID=A0A926Y1B3_9BACT|nr:hypothetical protein [Spirosoma profusum]MBD2704131.1 hypothetical protein [Spirosoma profusum]
MQSFRFSLHLVSLLTGLLFGLQNCKKSEPDPAQPGGTTTPGSTTTTTPGSTTSATSTAPTFSTATAPATSGVTTTSANVSAVLNSNGGATITQHGFIYSKINQTPTLSDSKTELGTTSGPFPLTIISKLTTLEANATYYVRAYATNEKGTGYSAVVLLKTTQSALPVLTIKEAENITSYGFKALAIFTALGGSPSPVSKYGFVWATSNTTPTVDGTDTKKWDQVINGLTTSTFSYEYTISGLSANQTCYVRAFGEYAADGKTNVVYSDVLPVKTLPQAVLTGTWKDLGKYNQSSYSSFLTIDTKQFWVTSTNTYQVEPLTAALTKKADFPGTASGTIRLASVGQKIYVLHGRDKALNYVRETWEYDIPTNTWKRKADFPGNLRMSPSVGSVGGKIYYGLGTMTSSVTTRYTDWWEYDPTADKWTQKTDLPEQLQGNTLLGVSSKLYFIATYDQGNSTQKVYEYDPGGNSWKRLKDAPSSDAASESKTVSLLNNKIYALQNSTTNARFWEYDAPSDTWTERREFSAKVNSPLLFPGNNKMYVIGTVVPGFELKMLEFTP